MHSDKPIPYYKYHSNGIIPYMEYKKILLVGTIKAECVIKNFLSRKDNYVMMYQTDASLAGVQGQAWMTFLARHAIQMATGICAL